MPCKILDIYFQPLMFLLNRNDVKELFINKDENIIVITSDDQYEYHRVSLLTYDYWKLICCAIAHKNNQSYIDVNNFRVSAIIFDRYRFEAFIGNQVNNKLSITIRRINNDLFTLENYNLEYENIKQLTKLIKKGGNILISGGSNCGKTTFLRCLINYIPLNSKIVLIEDVNEIKLTKHSVAVSYVLHINSDISSYNELINHLLRSNPDYIIFGEVTIQNVFPITRLLNSGHKGLITTIHASSVLLAKINAFQQCLKLSGHSLEGVELLLNTTIDSVIHIQKNERNREVTCMFFE